MNSRFLTGAFVFISTLAFSQEILVEYDKNKDMSVYKTFSMGEHEITTPQDQRLLDAEKLHALVVESIEAELTEKGLMKVDSNAHLVVSYIIGSVNRSSVQYVGPLGGTPGMESNRNVMRDYRESSFVIDLNDRSKNLIWRINATTNINTTNPKLIIEEVLGKGFKKFGVKPKKKKKK